MKHNIDLKNEFDIAVLAFVKAVYIQSKYDKDKVRVLFADEVIEAVMLTIDITERNKGEK
ncbi:hypothetical protein L5B71_08575 [Avibacterium sp. 21-586]|uniref:hypothetical protein n=1 Tax=Avibacterium sp. 21-586 TaxID=2911534 RepID=UPI0022480D2A|nr:hypothetical protein [Avibacterium sp. 21-586]MCW9710889.1 hypothetical protein [Avibacterium sp. 21-586]